MSNSPKRDAAIKAILDNPGVMPTKLSSITGLSIRTLQEAKAYLRNNKHDDEVKETKLPETSFIQNKEGAEYSFKTSKVIKSLDDLVQACDIDLSQWQIERFICNKWEVGAKDNDGKIQVTPLFQVKIWLKPFNKSQTEIVDIISKLVSESRVCKLNVPKKEKIKFRKALKVTLSDLHVGLDPFIEGKSIFNYVYNERIFNENLDKVYTSIVNEHTINGKFDVLFIDDLGDGLDGWNARTTRGEHSLDQNMDNTEAFRVYVTGKLRFIEKLIAAGVANNYEIKSVSNCNHAGSFGYIANYTIGLILNRTYKESLVKNIVLEKFMEHFEYGEHAFILTHGKDSKYQFKGLPLELNDKAIKFITDYINHYKINSKYIHVCKGDLHRIGYNKTTSFDYRNYMSFAPPSVWQQHNFGDCYAGYSIDIIPFTGNDIKHTDYFFELETQK